MLTRRGARQAALWPFGGAPGSRALPAAIGAHVVDALPAEADRKSLRLAHTSARAAVDARVRSLEVELAPASALALCRALTSTAGGAPPRFAALRSLMLYNEQDLHPAGLRVVQLVVPLLRALPALRVLGLVTLLSESAATALRGGLAAAAPHLELLKCAYCSAGVTAGLAAAARQLESLDVLSVFSPRLAPLGPAPDVPFAASLMRAAPATAFARLKVCARTNCTLTACGSP